MPEPRILWRPTERQAEFLAATEDEVLYGGAAGGGKTDALVIDALGAPYKAVELSEYRAIILRRTYPELKEVVDRTQAIYPAVCRGASFNQQAGEWRFPSGARIEFGYLERDSDVMRYQSRQYQWIGWEELAQWTNEYPYDYMLSRLRAPERLAIPCFMRATCNPDGPGARWLSKRFAIGASGQSTSVNVAVNGKTWRRRFIASRLDDNPHLSGTGYREKLMMLPAEIKRALLDGRWDEPVVGGAIYSDALVKAREEGRICAVPYDPSVRVDTWWDLGIGDATAIWFSQTVGREVHLIDYYEASGEGFPFYAQMLDKKGYVYGRHVAPHDIAVRELGSGRSRVETAASLGIKFEVSPNIGLEDGIHAVRMIFGKFWFDQKKCAPGIEALVHYRRDYNKRLGEYKSTPVHDWSSHGADGLRTLGVAFKIVPDKRASSVRTVQSGSQAQGWMGS